jgi:YVTN family beta-propeller protein
MATPSPAPVATGSGGHGQLPGGPASGGTGGRDSAVEPEPEPDADGGTAPGNADSGMPDKPRPDCTLNAYVSNSGSDSVSVIDTTSNQVVATIPTGKAPVNPTFTPDRRHVYVANSQDTTISVIDVATNQVTTIPAGGERPSGLAFSPDGDTLFVSLISEDYVSPGSVHSIKLRTGEVSASIPMGADPERIALTPDGTRLFVNNLLDGTMAVIDTGTNAVITTVTLGDLPFNPLMSIDGSVVYVGVMSANHIAVVDTNTYQVLRTIPADSPNGMSYSHDFQSLFVSNALSGTVQEVSLTKDMVVQTGMVGGLSGNMTVLPDGEHAYMVRPDGTTVEVLRTSDLIIVETITVGSGPSVVTVCR